MAGLFDTTEIYKLDNAIPVLISVILFVLHSVISLMDINMYIKDIGIGDEVISKALLLGSYFGGYFMYFLRTITTIIMLYIFISIIRIAITTPFKMIPAISGESAGEMAGNLGGTLQTFLIQIMRENAIWLLGLFMVHRSLITFSVVTPFFFLLLFMGFPIFIYNDVGLKELEQENKDESLQALNTTHHHIYFLLIIIIMIVIAYITSIYINEVMLLAPVPTAKE